MRTMMLATAALAATVTVALADERSTRRAVDRSAPAAQVDDTFAAIWRRFRPTDEDLEQRYGPSGKRGDRDLDEGRDGASKPNGAPGSRAGARPGGGNNNGNNNVGNNNGNNNLSSGNGNNQVGSNRGNGDRSRRGGGFASRDSGNGNGNGNGNVGSGNGNGNGNGNGRSWR